MANREIKTKVAIDGEKEYKESLKNINSALGTLKSELKLVESQYAGQANSYAALSAKGDVLSRMYDQQKEKVRAAAEQLEKAKKAQSDYAEKVASAQSEIARCEAALAALGDETGDTTKEQEKLTAELEKAKSELSAAEKGYASTTRSVNSYQTQVNNAEVELNKLDSALNKNASYLDEAAKSSDGCAESINEYGDEVKRAGEDSEEAGKKFDKVKTAATALGAAAAAATAALAAAAIKLGKEVISAYADYEQLVGGVETLFKESSGKVMEYANNAYKTAGLSANEYMETVTGFSASLIASLGGDTEKAAEYADMAITDMSDNANKMGSDMASIQNAYGDGGMQVYRTLRNAQDREHVMLMDLRNAAKKFLDADVYKNRFERHTFTTGRGVELTLTSDQIMNLYNLARRGEQAMHHLTVGGIVQPEIQRNGKLKAIPRGNDNILLTEEDIKAITSVLTPEQIKVANGLQKLASTKLAEWGNEASMQVYGYRKFKEENYWPIKAAKDAVASSVEKDADNARSIKNMGSAKALTPNASNALDIGGAYDVFAQNASDMIKYATLLAPMEDINRLYNYRYRDSMGNLTGKNVRQVLSGVYGDAAQSYWRNLMRDVQSGMVKSASSTTRTVERIVGNTKGAAVGANLRVIIQQPTAYCRAAVVLEPENMTKGLTKGATAGNGWDKARKWAAIAGIKDTSGFDQGSRYTISREVYGSDGNVREWLNDKSMALAGKADAVTWGKIWNACEWQVAANTNTEVGSDAYYRQVAELFTDVIDQTQVVDGVMQRTQIMRDSDALTRQATSFMGEPLKSLNVLMRAYDAWVYETNPHKRSKALKQLKRSVGALLVTDVVNALAQSIVDGLRDDDKDKNWAERILEAFTGYSGDEKNAGEAVKNVVLGGNLISNINPVGRIPYLKDILSILQGYTVDRMDAAAADDIIRTSKTFIKGLGGDSKTTTAYNLKQVMLMCSKVFGISVGNMGRDMWSIARSIANDTGNVRVMFEMEKAIYRMDRSAGNRKRWCELLYRAQKDKDTETARLIYKEMLEHGYEESDVRQGVEAIMKNEQGVESVKELKNRWRAP